MKIILTGVPGSGKTTICERLKNKIRDVNVVNMGNLIFEIAKRSFPGKIKVRDDTRKIPKMKYKEVQREAALKLAKFTGDLIVDTHLSLKTPNGYYPGLTREMLNIIKPDVIILLNVSPDEIVRRREKDFQTGKRISRDVETAADVDRHQRYNEYYAVAYSSLTGCYINSIDLTWKQEYDYQHADKVVSEIIKMIKLRF